MLAGKVCQGESPATGGCDGFAGGVAMVDEPKSNFRTMFPFLLSWSSRASVRLCVCRSASAEAKIGVRFFTYGMDLFTALSVCGVEDASAMVGVSSGLGKVNATLPSARGVS